MIIRVNVNFFYFLWYIIDVKQKVGYIIQNDVDCFLYGNFINEEKNDDGKYSLRFYK